MMLNNDYYSFRSHVSRNSQPRYAYCTARAKELLEELYQLYNIDLLQPLRSCIQGIHLVTEFIEHKLNQGVEESTLFESLIAWKTRNDVDRATKATSTEDLQDSETTNEGTPL